MSENKITLKKTSYTKRLNDTIHLIPEHAQEIAKEYITELGFMRSVLDSLKADIAEIGAVELWVNGAQKNTRQTPAYKSYLETTNRYNQYLKQFLALYPTDEEETVNELKDFLKAGVN